jgi:hypothetical protein
MTDPGEGTEAWPGTLSPEVIATVKRWAADECDEMFRELHQNVILVADLGRRTPSRTEMCFEDMESPHLRRVRGVSDDEIRVAAQLFPLHSQMCAMALLVVWKTNSLVRTAFETLNAREVLIAAGVTRMLIEVTAAFGVDVMKLLELWSAQKRSRVRIAADVGEFHKMAKEALNISLFGTKAKSGSEPWTGIKRLHTETMLKKAAELSEIKWITKVYDALCEVVHPSVQSNTLFFSDEGRSQRAWCGPKQMLERDTRGHTLGLTYNVVKGLDWALEWLLIVWIKFSVMRNDLCLTAKTYVLPDADYWGSIRPSAAAELCVCGSGLPGERCKHAFGEAG